METMRSKENFTSSLVRALPLAKVSPSFNVHVYTVG